MNELNRWCPSLRAFRFHGNKEERQNQADTYLTNEAASDVGTRPSNTLADGTDDHSKSLRKVRERSGAERASLDEDEHTRDESTPAKSLQTATSTTKLTHSFLFDSLVLLLPHFH